MADKDPIKVEVVPTTGMVEQPSTDEKKVLQAQAEQMYGKTDSHAPSKPVRIDHTPESNTAGAPVAQGMNLSKEEAEFAANALQNPKAEELEPEKIPAPVQASEEPIAKAGVAPKEHKTKR